MSQNQASQTGGIKLGRVSITGLALRTLDLNSLQPSHFLARHKYCDWGDVTPEERFDLNAACLTESKVVSKYNLPVGGTLLILTDADRCRTEVLMEQEF